MPDTKNIFCIELTTSEATPGPRMPREMSKTEPAEVKVPAQLALMGLAIDMTWVEEHQINRCVPGYGKPDSSQIFPAVWRMPGLLSWARPRYPVAWDCNGQFEFKDSDG